MELLEEFAERAGEEHQHEVGEDRQHQRGDAREVAVLRREGDRDGDRAGSGDQRRGQRHDRKFGEVVAQFILPLLEELPLPDRQPADEEDHQSAGDLERVEADPENLLQHELPDDGEGDQHQQRRERGLPRKLPDLAHFKFRLVG